MAATRNEMAHQINEYVILHPSKKERKEAEKKKTEIETGHEKLVQACKCRKRKNWCKCASAGTGKYVQISLCLHARLCRTVDNVGSNVQNIGLFHVPHYSYPSPT